MASVDILTAIANVATAIGVGVAAYQLMVTRKQAVTAFEDSLTSQYRAIIERLPLEALFGEPLSAGDQKTLLPHFYRYFDLCNEQAFLHKNGRVSPKTWSNWRDGIVTNMQRPAFAVAWAEVAQRATDDFSELRALCPPNQHDASESQDA